MKNTSDSDQGMSSTKDRNFRQVEKYRAILIKKNHSEHLVPITMLHNSVRGPRCSILYDKEKPTILRLFIGVS